MSTTTLGGRRKWMMITAIFSFLTDFIAVLLEDDFSGFLKK